MTRPSAVTPRDQVMPIWGIHRWDSYTWYEAGADQSNTDAATYTPSASSTRETTRATTRPAARLRGGTKPRRAAPAAGTATRTDSHGKLAAIIALSIVVYPLQPESEDDG